AEMEVASGGLEARATVSGGATLVVLPGGVDGNANRFLAPDGLAGATILSGGTEMMFGMANGATVNSGGVAVVASGGTAVENLINSGGLEVISSGGGTRSHLVARGGGGGGGDGGLPSRAELPDLGVPPPRMSGAAP